MTWVRHAPAGWGLAVGLTCLAASLLRYRSYEHRAVLGLWSPSFTILLCLVWSLALMAAVLSAGRWRRLGTRASPSSGWLWQVGVAAAGVGYLLGSTDASQAGRALRGVLLASESPVSSFVSLFALGCFALALMTLIFRRRHGMPEPLVALLLAFTPVCWLGEMAARVHAFAAPSTQNYPSYASDVWKQRYVRLNGAGFRDSDHAVTAGSGVRRLVLLGDSFAFGWGIRDVRGRLGESLVTELERDCGSSWESLNFSRPNTHTLEHLRFLEAALRFRPDVIVLEYVFNDIDYLAWTTGSALPESSSIFARLSPRALLFGNSFLFQQLYLRWVKLRASGNTAGSWNDPYLQDSLLDRHVRDLLTLSKAAESSAARFVVLPVDHGVLADASVKARYSRVIGRMRSAGLLVIPTDSAFIGHPLKTLSVNALDGHPNALSNALLATFLAPRLRDALALADCPRDAPQRRRAGS